MEYFTFPMETLNVTQSYTGTYSHLEHTTGSPKDYPIDIAGNDSGQSPVFARVPLKVIAKRGMGNKSVTNTIWLETVDTVITPTFTDKVWMTLTHWNDQDPAINKWKVGSTIPEGSIICYEGTDGASANHIHLVVGRGKCSSWTENSKGKWVMAGDSYPPEQVLYIDPTFTTTIKNEGGLGWQDLPKYIGTPVDKDSTKNQLEVLVSKLNVRKDPTTEAKSLGYINLGIYDYSAVVEKESYRWYQISLGWIADDGSWLIIYPKEEKKDDSIEQFQQEITTLKEQLKEKEEQISQLEKDKDLKTFIPTTDGYYYLKLTSQEILYYKVQKKDETFS